jgi:hypothetical protein
MTTIRAWLPRISATTCWPNHRLPTLLDFLPGAGRWCDSPASFSLFHFPGDDSHRAGRWQIKFISSGQPWCAAARSSPRSPRSAKANKVCFLGAFVQSFNRRRWSWRHRWNRGLRRRSRIGRPCLPSCSLRSFCAGWEAVRAARIVQV